MTTAKQTAEQVQAEILLNQSEAFLASVQGEGVELENNKLRRAQELENCADFLYNYIIFDEDVNEISVMQFKSLLRRMVRRTLKTDGEKTITIELNTPGGSIVDGFAMLDELLGLRKRGWVININVLGQAASMGAVILQAATNRTIGENSLIMIHRAAFGAMGKAYEIEDELEFVKKLEGKIASIFAKASGRPIEDFHFLFDKRRDIWFDAEEAVAAGLADSVYGG